MWFTKNRNLLMKNELWYRWIVSISARLFTQSLKMMINRLHLTVSSSPNLLNTLPVAPPSMMIQIMKQLWIVVKVCQIWLWWNSKWHNSIFEWYIAMEVVPLCSVGWAPLYELAISLLMTYLSTLLIHKLTCTAGSASLYKNKYQARKGQLQ